jgi:hypothetical protein
VEENKKSKTNTDRTTGGRKWEEEEEEEEEGVNVCKTRAHPREKKKKHKIQRKQEGKEIRRISYKLRQVSQNSARRELNLFKHTQTRNQL